MKKLIQLLFICSIILSSCNSMKNQDNPKLVDPSEGRFVKTSDGVNIFVYTYEPITSSKKTVYLISGYTGINHNTESDIIELLSDNSNRVIIMHPRGTGYSEGKRGDVSKYTRFLDDFIEIIQNDVKERGDQEKIILYGHSISTAICLAIANRLHRVNGIILVNPPYKMKTSKGMTPCVFDYVRYAGYMIFAPHNPIVNMAGNFSEIQNIEEKREAEAREMDPLLVKYISMYMMFESKKIMDKMVENAKQIDSPLLLIYGSNDSLVDKSGCDEIYNSWKALKAYHIISNGPHGKLTVIYAKEIIQNWIKEI